MSEAEHRPATRGRPVSARGRIVAVAVAVALAGCATGRNRGPRTLGFAGAVVAVGGSVVWVVGDRRSDPGILPAVGIGVVAAGVAAMIAAGGWIAARVGCQADPDCDESEECREIPAPPGGVPYKQCMAR